MKQQAFISTEFRSSVFFQAILLGTSALVATTLLSTGDLETRDTIKLRAEEDLKQSIGQVISDQLHDNDLLKSTVSLMGSNGEPITVYQGSKDGSITALAFSVSSYGYGGKILAIMALNPAGEILGVRILSHAETPGLGDKIEIEKNDWILGFNGLSLASTPAQDWAVKKDGGRFDQFSGATITPRAVVKAVKQGLDFFVSQQDKLLTPVISKEDSQAITVSQNKPNVSETQPKETEVNSNDSKL